MEPALDTTKFWPMGSEQKGCMHFLNHGLLFPCAPLTGCHMDCEGSRIRASLEMEEQVLAMDSNTMKNLIRIWAACANILHFLKFVVLFKTLLFWFSVRRAELNPIMLLVFLHFRDKYNILSPNTYLYNLSENFTKSNLCISTKSTIGWGCGDDHK